MNLIFWPFKLIILAVQAIFLLTGKLLTIALGFVLIILGLIFTLTVVGAMIGIPLIVLGFVFSLHSIL